MTFVRQDVYSLAPDDPVIVWYGNAVAAMLGDNGPTGWIHQADMHATFTTPVPTLGNECRHQSWYFLSWHRMYVYFFERIVRARIVSLGGPADWALPYWDYDRVGTRAIPPAFRSPTRPDGSPNPLYVAQRAAGINAGGTLDPAITTAAFALSRPSYTGVPEFGGGIASPAGQFMGQTGRLEQTPHNDIHVAVGGPTGWMRDPRMAARDPIFWLHHANVDRLWWEWNKTHANPTDPAWLNQSFPFFDVNGQQTSLATSGIQDIVKQLDYSYVKLIKIPPVRIRFPVEVFRRRPPWPPWIREVVVPRIPDRPEPPRPPGPGPDPEMIGANDDAVRLVGHTERVRVSVDKRARRTVLGDAAPKRVVLDISGIDAEESPGTVYAVYVNLPEGASAEEAAAHHVGNVSLFGIERTRDPGNDEHAHGGMRVAVDITDLAGHLAERGLWDDDGLDVTFRPVGVQLPDEPEDDAEEMSEDTIRSERVHEDLPIKIGRISLHVE